MPYKPFKRNDEWCVFKVDADGNPTGERLGCHPTLTGAMQQVRALYATENKDYQWSQATAEYTTSATGEQMCSGCMYFQDNNEQPATCLVVEDKPEPIGPDGWCKFWIPAGVADKQADPRLHDSEYFAIVPDRENTSTWKLPLLNAEDVANAITALSPAGFRGNRVEIPRGVSRESVINKISRRIGDIQATDERKAELRERLNKIKSFSGVAIFKGDDGLRYMLLITSNSYEDREGETITTKALQDYVARSWEGGEFVGTNNLYYEHKGLPIGSIVWCAMEGPFLLECAKERPGAHARKRWDAIEADPAGWGASHGFNFRRSQRVNGTYYKIYKFETTVLKRDKAANLLTFAGVFE